MKSKILFLICLVFCLPFSGWADETELFKTAAPDALIILDLSGSMDQNPSGGDRKYGNSTACTANTTYCTGSTADCSGGYCNSTKTNCSTDCSKLAIAKRTIFAILDDNSDLTINADDHASLGVRIGFMRYRDGNDTAGVYSSGNIILINEINTAFSKIYCKSDTECLSTTTACSGGGECVVGESANGGTPLASSMVEAKSYLDVFKAADTEAKTCRSRFVIVITDGEDTYACSGSGSSGSAARRRETVARAKALAVAGYKTFMIGFGAGMPTNLKNTLNWAAYYGGTQNTSEAPSGSVTQYNLTTSAFYPTGVASCSTSTSNDPGNYNLSGYAFLAASGTELTATLKKAFSVIKSATYSFSAMASVSASRIQDENYIYEATFEPIDKESFWTGHLKKYSIKTTGDLDTVQWDAGQKLKDTAASARNVLTYKGDGGGILTSFNTTNITASVLNVADSSAATDVVQFFLGDPSYNVEGWKLGDIFRSNPVTVGTPTSYFFDPRQCGGTSYSSFGASNPRTSANGQRLVLIGANDAQLHAFRTGNGSGSATGGDETWSFIPPNLLQKLRYISHKTHAVPVTSVHEYFVDGPIQVADAWLGTGNGVSKASTEWKTLAIVALGQGAGIDNVLNPTTAAPGYLWSKSSTCYSTSDSDFNSTFERTTPTATTFPYYCGYHALDVTTSMQASPYKPIYLWHLNPTSAQAPYLGEPWSKMQLGRVRSGTSVGDEKWVGFIGGGYYSANCTTSACTGNDRQGKGFFVVDLKPGATTGGFILKSFTRADNNNMNYSIPAAPLAIDTDNDGFIDTAYVGDLGGNIWRFRFCPKDPYCYSCGLGSYTGSSCDTTCTKSQWTMSLLYQASDAERPKRIFTSAAAAKDPNGNLWIYFGTGDKVNPLEKVESNRFYAIKENSDFTGTLTLASLTNITSVSSYTDSDDKHGWYLDLVEGAGEKVLSDPTVFGGVIYFTTYLPAAGTDACEKAGKSILYGLGYISGEGKLGSDRNLDLVGTTGIASTPVISMRPGSSAADLYITTSGGSGTDAITKKIISPASTSSMTNMLYWRDRRVQ
jgi:Tfp pilus tip-associated adhesin PilY1